MTKSHISMETTVQTEEIIVENKNVETAEETITIFIIRIIEVIEDGEVEITLIIEKAAEQDILLDQRIIATEAMHKVIWYG